MARARQQRGAKRGEYWAYSTADCVRADRATIVHFYIGTTTHGDIERIERVLEPLSQHQAGSYIHCDAVLADMMLPFLADAPRIDFARYPIDSVRGLCAGASAADPSTGPVGAAVGALLYSPVRAIGLALPGRSHLLHHRFDQSGTDSMSSTHTQRFKRIRRLGAGGMGVVYEALDQQRNTRVALKTLRHLTPQGLSLFKSEFRLLQDLDHPNLVTLGELVNEDGQWFFTMELIEGRDFLAHVRAPGHELQFDDTVLGIEPTLPIDQVPALSGHRSSKVAVGQVDWQRLRAALGQTASGLTALHDAGLVHRDIKPSNVLVDRVGRVVLLDYGLVVSADPERQADGPAAGSIVGTVAYMAPEQASGIVVDARADWYSLGVMMYEAMTGVLPYAGTPQEILAAKRRERAPAPGSRCPGIPDELDALCVRMLEIDPGKRPGRVEILTVLQGRPGQPRVRVMTAGDRERTRLFGRDQELSELDAAYRQCRQGMQATVIVEGESGIGKSHLMRAFAGHVSAADGAVVLAGRCRQREQVPFKAVDGVIDALTRYLCNLPAAQVPPLLPDTGRILLRVFPVLGQVPGMAGLPAMATEIRDPLELRKRAFSSLRELLARVANRVPLVVMIDDLQWADADSELLLQDVLRAPEAPPLLLLASWRTIGEPALDNAFASARHIRLQPLAREPARALARHVMGRDRQALEHAAIDIAEEARGHPLFICELVQHLSQGDSDGTEAPLDEPAQVSGQTARFVLDRAIWQRVCRMPAEAIDTLSLLSLSGSPLPPPTLCTASGLAVRDFDRCLHSLRVARLIRAFGDADDHSLEPYHDRVREAVIAGLDEPAQLAIHQRLADALSATPGERAPSELLLYHCRAAGRTGEAAGHAVRAAERAAHGLAFGRAAGLYEEALELGEFDDRRARALRIAMADALARSGRGVAAATVLQEVAETSDDAGRRICLLGAQEHLLAAGRIERGLSVLHQLLRDAGINPPGSTRATLVRYLWHRLRLAGLQSRLRAFQRRQPTTAAPDAKDLLRCDVMVSASLSLGVIDPLQSGYFAAVALRLALQMGDASRMSIVLGIEAANQAVTGNHVFSRELLNGFRPMMEFAGDRSDDPFRGVFPQLVDSISCFSEGRLHRGAALAGECEAALTANPPQSRAYINASQLILFLCRFHTGHFKALYPLLRDYIIDAHRREDRYSETTVKRGFTQVWIARGELDTARRYLRETSWISEQSGYHYQHAWSLASEMDLAQFEGRLDGDTLERLDAGYEVARRSLLFRSNASIRTWVTFAWGRWLLASAQGRTRPARQLRGARHCIRILERSPMAMGRPFASSLRASAALVRGDHERAARLLERTMAQARDHEMDGLHAAAAYRSAQLARRAGDLDECRRLEPGIAAYLRREEIAIGHRMLGLWIPGPPHPADIVDLSES